MPSAYLSGLGTMGRRHLKGLVRAGFDVMASDPNAVAFDVARADLLLADLPVHHLRIVDAPDGRFDVAVFSETAPSRLANFRRFLSTSCADRILLEKPLSADPAGCDSFLSVAQEHGVQKSTQVNLARRTWPHVQRLANLCADERRFAMTLNGGAIGLGSTGIHYLDTFLLLAGDDVPQIVWSSLSDRVVASGRGEQFQDYGADFVLQGVRGRLLASLEAASSANVVMTVRGEHFIAQVDYTDLHWKLAQRKPGSKLPNYRYGADYQIVEDERVEIPAMDAVTESWALGRLQLPSLDRAHATHHLLTDILRAGGALPPYRFT